MQVTGGVGGSPAWARLDLARSRRRLVLASTAFALLAFLVLWANPTLLRVDSPLSTGFRGTALSDGFREVTSLGTTEVALAATILVAFAFWRRCRRFAVVYAAAILLGGLLNVALKAAVDRPRPPNPDPGVALASFPSGHAFQATLVFGLLPIGVALVSEGRRWARVTAALAAVGIAAVAVSRVYLGAHWPTDVVGGVLVGAALIEGARHVLARSHRRGTCACGLSPT